MTSRRGALFAVTIAGILAADQVTKWLVRSTFEIGESRPIVSGALWLTHVENTGAAFGMLRGQQWLLIATAVLMLAVVAYVMLRVRPADGWVRFSLSLVTGGAIGIILDRHLRALAELQRPDRHQSGATSQAHHG